jgi:hypothetical protein
MGTFLKDIFANRFLWAAISSWLCAQVIKIIIEAVRNRRFNPWLLLSSGGMPSSHTAFVSAIATAIGATEGIDSPIFAVCMILSLVVMYDAQGVRRAAGKQAEALNLLIASLEDSGVKIDKKLKEMIGHTPIEVAAGAVLGILVGVLFVVV